MATKITFRGGAGTVTGSCYLVEHDGGRFLVDCGMFQGNKTIRELNYAPFPFDPGAIDYLLLTHAHIDHSGLVPKLTRHGFAGPIHATAPTLDLLTFMLPDSGKIQEGEVERKNRTLRRQGKPQIEAIYTQADAEVALENVAPHGLEEWFEPGPGVKARFWNAGHILGAVSIELAIDDGGPRPLRVLFSGDLGPDEKVFHLAPDAPEGFDYVICESTYGDRDREDITVEARRAALEREIVEAMKRGGNLVIPSFAVERSQELLHDIGVLLAEGRIPASTPVFLDSPLASRVTKVFIRHADTLDDIALDEAKLFRHPNFRITEDVEDSKAINRISGGAIIISASGMCEAGRIRHHLKNNLWRREATVLFVGYQAPGTLGAIIQGGADEVRIHGSDIKVRATIRSLGSYSAHADQAELLAWIRERLPVSGGIFLTHGEDHAREVLSGLLVGEGVPAERIHLPQLDDVFALKAGKQPLRHAAEATRVRADQIERDWANDYVAFTLALSRRLDAMPDDETKQDLVARLDAVLEEVPD
ncbi:MAG: MBL fold metallo-hydrolase [Bauldia sp.]|uniref:MBL fold metallo-hydrolase n=1 Tax=Bauldia sp. TaxID=2575872 RepID=UPI001D49C161|nr:MBL fold metallo-hydrolase [Bauldia sp.]MCB1498017.1 MBL fold metallo-hydrolase [Bauldia sp.]